jgi:NAD(P) transhydrogenase subunit beta
MTREQLISVAYLLAGVLFILGLRGLTRPKTAVRGNQLGALGMLLAMIATLWDAQVLRFELIILGLVIGAALGAVFAWRVPMTAMPQMVALLNGFGGLASLLVAGAELLLHSPPDAAPAAATARADALTTDALIAAAASGVIGAVTFGGSMVAVMKLQWSRFEKPVYFKGQQVINGLLAAGALGLCVWAVAVPEQVAAYWSVVVAASALGVLLVLPIGGADMPVVIALLNSYSGLAAAATGFVLGNSVLIVSGSLVGASGVILTQIMCRAMNRSMFNVLFGVLAPSAGGATAEEVYSGRIKSTSPEEVAMILETARRVVVVPGYGLAVAQAQFTLQELAQILEDRGATVEYAIHPVAGRMPGHMNVLLAEANVPYEKLKDLDEINPSFPQTDVVLVIGANDVVNPLARTDPKSPIAGMPILDVDKARTVVVVKRSLSPGFAGIPNPLFAADNCLMLFADGKKAVLEIVAAMKA